MTEQGGEALYQVAVRALCEFSAKRGDLDLRFTPSPSALEGIAGHTLVTSRRPAHYQREVALDGRYRHLQVRGRADGYDPQANCLEEIKTHRGDLALQPANHRHLHWAQARVYGWLLCAERKLEEVELALVYLEVGSQKETRFVERVRADELRLFFESQCQAFLAWAEQELAHRQRRDRELAALRFPHAEFRHGQRQLAEAVYKAASAGCCLMAQAPTGIGKTIGTLFPQLKAMPGQRLDRLFFLAAKTPGRALALHALRSLEGETGGLPVRVLELVARDKACEHPDKACHGESCPLAQGFYERLPAARAAAVEARWLDQARLREVALAHRVCPYYLGQELARWCDLAVGDYNYYFDLGAMLHGLAQVNQWRVAVLVDEAHNLVERGRRMYSAELDQGDFLGVRKTAPEALRKPLERIQRAWNELAATRSEYRSDRTTRYTPAAGILDLYLGRKLGERDGYPVYDPDPARLGRPLSEEEWRSLRRNVTQHSESYSQTYSFTGNGELFDLPAGPVAFAGVLEVGKQGYRIRPDSQYNDGSLYNVSKASSSGGSRDRYAAGGEFSIPLHDTLLASAAGRWDQYRFSGRTEEQTTYNLGLEWRPLTSLLLRGSYGTSFRAPDLNYIYQADANGYYPAQKDYYGCEKGVDGACKNGRVDYVQSGTPDLKSERGRYWSYGFVWSPSSRFDFSADYYHIQIDDLLTTLDPDKLLRDEAACRSGGLDPDSAQCRDTLARVERNAGDASVDPNRLNKVYVNAINAAKERTSGIDLRSNIRWGAGDYGAFSSTLGYTLVLSHDYKQSDDYPSENQRDSLDSHDWRSKLNASLTWDYAQFTSTLFAVRYGSVTNAAGSGRLSPWTVFNASARYRLNERASVGLTVNNLLDQIKEDDSDGWPYYPTGNYDAMGRQWWLDFSYHFGG